jgi:hypothetical protein
LCPSPSPSPSPCQNRPSCGHTDDPPPPSDPLLATPLRLTCPAACLSLSAILPCVQNLLPTACIPSRPPASPVAHLGKIRPPGREFRPCEYAVASHIRFRRNRSLVRSEAQPRLGHSLSYLSREPPNLTHVRTRIRDKFFHHGSLTFLAVHCAYSSSFLVSLIQRNVICLLRNVSHALLKQRAPWWLATRTGSLPTSSTRYTAMRSMHPVHCTSTTKVLHCCRVLTCSKPHEPLAKPRVLQVLQVLHKINGGDTLQWK